ncbi:MAG: hypothetical protein R3C44_21905 [Chloroflexota bacterium]
MYIIPIADAMLPYGEGAGDMSVSGTLAGLQTLIQDRPDPFPRAGIPALPLEHVGAAFNDLAVQGKYIGFGWLARYAFCRPFLGNDGSIYQ